MGLLSVTNPALPKIKYVVTDGTAADHAASLAQLQAGGLIYIADTGAADVYVATLVPAITVLTTGMETRVKITNANLTTTPTLEVSGLGANTIKRGNSAALLVGDLPVNHEAIFRYNGTDQILQNPAILELATDAVEQAHISAAAVGQGELKTTTGDVTVALVASGTGNTPALPGGLYGFRPQARQSAGSGTLNFDGYGSAGLSGSLVSPGGAFAETGGSFGATGLVREQYFQASPPYMIGDKIWGHFVFLLRNISTGDVFKAYSAEDPPWMYNGKVWLPKDHKDRIIEVPHPFTEYFEEDPVIDGFEIVLIDLSGVDVDKWIADNWKVGKSILEDLNSVLVGKGTDRPWDDYNVPAIPRFTDRVKVIIP